MKYKFFSADGHAKLKQAVNAWMAQQGSPVTVKLSDTKMQSFKANGKEVVAATVGLWYE